MSSGLLHAPIASAVRRAPWALAHMLATAAAAGGRHEPSPAATELRLDDAYAGLRLPSVRWSMPPTTGSEVALTALRRTGAVLVGAPLSLLQPRR